MNERQMVILKLLINYSEYKIGDLEKELGLTRRCQEQLVFVGLGQLKM